ncbi:YdeI/OmpD-associated family protein [Cognatiyoonia sp. IB215182]|uniref:YdeI/OmpD-associated family protein n=1 Tax=Cognatiyoonia sp. IB215182 TaxID=3097353 RepID=UPI002A181352|nr:YdeI/OmpD-associated family protein [Cognatiyoonia sp. IB215182]MDX8353627.1 YdeI/OmpD-associated family protein [Cognatiyoonia sp. IB215182]
MMITEIEDYFTKGCGRCTRFATPECSTKQWAEGLNTLRALCLEAGLEEVVKWGHPCYMHAGRNIAIIGAFRGDFRLSFFDAALLKDPDGVLEKQGPNTQYADMIRFTDNDRVAALAITISGYLAEAMGYARDGIRPPKNTDMPDLPDELIEALDCDTELAEAFHALTPGRQKSYVINLNGAKKPETRIARITKFRDKIIAGKGAMER